MITSTNGYELFSISENFLSDLSTEDESLISGGSGRKGSRSKSKTKSKKKSRSKSYGYCGYH